MALDVVAWRALQAGDVQRTKAILLGPELVRFEAMAAAAERLASYEAGRSLRTQTAPSTTHVTRPAAG